MIPSGEHSASTWVFHFGNCTCKVPRGQKSQAEQELKASPRYLKEKYLGVNPEYSLEGLVAEAEAPVLWPPDSKSRLIGKDSDAGKH